MTNSSTLRRTLLFGLVAALVLTLSSYAAANAAPILSGRLSPAPAPSAVEAPLDNISQIAAGVSHTCALMTNGSVKCWGYNANGQVGDNTTTNRSTPVDVVGLGGGVIAIAAGASHTCALSNSDVKCWGYNGFGQLGDGTETDRLTPVTVTGLGSGALAITAGSNHTCAVTSTGGVKCWGWNGYRVLGNDGESSPIPVDVIGLTSGVIDVAASRKEGDDGDHTCALTTGGGVKCWGLGREGQLGSGEFPDPDYPSSEGIVDVEGLASGVTAIAVGAYHSCAVTSSGALKCWGSNIGGELGDGGTTDRPAPTNVVDLSSGVTGVSAGASHTCATTSSGLKCWGWNGNGQLGNGTINNQSTPVSVIGLSGVTKVGAGSSHTCAAASGGLRCWGNNTRSQLGDGSSTEHLTPANVVGLSSGVAAVSTSLGTHTCALTNGGGVKCWGNNSSGQLGINSTNQQPTPFDVAGLGPALAVRTGERHTCALIGGGGVKCWGYNVYGQVGDGTTTQRLTPVNVTGLTSGVIAIATGDNHACAITSAGGLKCWGYNFNGQLGNNSTTNRSTPTDVTGLTSGVTAVAAGDSFTCAIISGGGLRCWGINTFGTVGDNSTTQRLTPVNVSGLTSGVTAVVAGTNHACALTSGGGVKCWGSNSSGQLGDSTVTQRLTPVNVTGLTSGVTAIAAGSQHTCAIVTGGSVKCWGANFRGNLGDGTNTQRTSPTDVVGLTSGVTAIAAGGNYTCAISNNGGLRCWGSNEVGELGTGDNLRTFPVAVQSTCFPLTLGQSGSGSVPVAVPDRSGSCPAGTYFSASSIALNATPATGWQVAGWSGTIDDASSANSNSVLMPVAAHSANVIYGEQAACYPLTLSFAGLGSVPVATPPNSAACPAGHYEEGELITLDASPASGWLVAGWNGTDDDTSTDASNSFTMPAAAHSTSVIYSQPTQTVCYGLTLSFAGLGTVPVATPPNSAACSSGHYVAGEQITLNATPEIGWLIEGWSGTDDDTSTSANNTLLMPAADHSASVAYVEQSSGQATCYLLTLAHSGSGSALGATPPNSPACSAGHYVAGEGITLNASPASGWLVASWSGTDDDTSTDASNSLSMPAAAHSASVAYSVNSAECYPLTLLHSGSGSDPQATPTHSDTCPSGFYEADTEITLVATPAAGWHVASWSGAESDDMGNSATVFMPAAQHTVNVDYAILSDTPPPAQGDEFEIDDTCGQASTIIADGTSQTHTFHQLGDSDWVRFDAGGATYRIEVHVPSDSPADVNLELFAACAEAATGGFAATFTPGVRLDIPAPASGVVYLRLTNAEIATAGVDVAYHLSVRRLDTAGGSGALILVAGRLKNSDPLQKNIELVTQSVYDLYTGSGYSADDIQYLATNPALKGYDLPATVQNLQEAILTWAPAHVGEDRLLTLYLMDHGDVDKFFMDGVNQQQFTPQELDGWLDQLETLVPGIKITLIVEACNSGSFIDGVQTVSQPGRLVIASTTEKDVAFASPSGAYFSDHLLMGLRQGYSLYNSYRAAYASTRELTNLFQEPWLDGNGNSIPNEPEDVMLASRQTMIKGSNVAPDAFAPYIVSAKGPEKFIDLAGIIQAEVRDNKGVRRVWAVIYPPSYQPPKNGVELVPDAQPTIFLQKQTGDLYAGEYPGFDEIGRYRIAIYAEDEDGLISAPTFVDGPVFKRLNIPVIWR